MKLSVFKTGIIITGTLCLLSACAPKLTFEAQEWRVAAMSSDDASVVVRYIGVVSPFTNSVARQKVAGQLRDLIADTSPAKPYTPRLRDATRKAYIEGDKLVVEESGLMNNPLSWSEQSGLNPFLWFRPSLGLTERDNYIVKRGIPPDKTILASSGNMIDNGTYNAKYATVSAIEGGSYDRAPSEAYAASSRIEVIVWPGAARQFYWKLSGPGYEKNWRSLASDLQKLPPPGETAEPVVPVKTTESTKSAEEPVAEKTE